MTRRKATGERIGVLFYNPGGPGTGAADLVRDWAPHFFSQELRERFDVVGTDPRGVGGSGQLQCGKAVHDPAVTQFPVAGGRPLTAEELRYSAYAMLTMAPDFYGGLARGIVEAEQGDAVGVLGHDDRMRGMARLAVQPAAAGAHHQDAARATDRDHA